MRCYFLYLYTYPTRFYLQLENPHTNILVIVPIPLVRITPLNVPPDVLVHFLRGLVVTLQIPNASGSTAVNDRALALNGELDDFLLRNIRRLSRVIILATTQDVDSLKHPSGVVDPLRMQLGVERGGESSNIVKKQFRHNSVLGLGVIIMVRFPINQFFPTRNTKTKLI